VSRLARPFALLPGLLVVGLALAACPADDAAHPEENAPASEAAKEAPATKGRPAPTAPGGPGAPSMPSPLPALNDFADRCARGGTSGEDVNAAGRHVALCAEALLETLRAAVGAAGLSQEEAGEVLESAETGVRRLAAGSRDSDAGSLAREAALGLTDLAALLDAETASMRRAAEAIDPAAGLADQPAALDAFFAAADATVRPRVRALAGTAGGGGV